MKAWHSRLSLASVIWALAHGGMGTRDRGHGLVRQLILHAASGREV